MSTTKKMLLISIFTSQALVLSIIERFIPILIPIPGFKLGLANIVSLFTIIILGFKESLIVTFLRVILSSIFIGSISSFLYSIVGGILSIVAMNFVYVKFNKFFSIISISVIGASFHNLGQILISSIVIEDTRVFYYLPFLILIGIFTGIFVGFAVKYSIESLKKILHIT